MTEELKRSDARFVWYWCSDCNCNYRLSDQQRHLAKHIQRPSDNALTLEEVRELLGKTKGELNHLLRTDRIKAIRKEGVRRIFVSRKALMDYAEGEMRRGNMQLMQKLTEIPEAKKRQNTW